MIETTAGLGAILTTACNELVINYPDSILSFSRAIDKISPELAKSDQARVTLGLDSTIWQPLDKVWKGLARAHSTFWEADEDDGKSPRQSALVMLCATMAKFTRNLVAGVPDNQSRAFHIEPELRRLLHYYTSWSAMEDEKSIAVARFLIQALSNLVTGHEELMNNLWETYLNLPEDQVIIIRLLGSPDAKTLLSTLIFILNCLHDSRKRVKLLCQTDVGVRICISLLDNMLRLFEADEGSIEAQAFDISYAILSHIIEERLAVLLYQRFIVQDEIITPHQTTLLKIVDSYLQTNQSTPQTPIKPETLQIHTSLTPMLTRAFFSLSRYAQISIHHSLGLDDQSGQSGSISLTSNHTGSPETLSRPFGSLKSVDVMLPKACEALVLVTQCMATIAIEAEENAVYLGLEDTNNPKTNMKNYLIEAQASDFGVVENLIELLRLLDMFLPRINFGRPVSLTGRPMGASMSDRGQEHIPDASTADNHGFAYLKRDLVRLLGILCHGKRTVQDRVREARGIEVVMNMCIIDERNPYLQEHAILTLRNLLKDNSENQNVVDSIQPSNNWDQRLC
ncbi:hypothetical protein Ac2012v2_003249 [Leucoagaricus gongylophorus]